MDQVAQRIVASGQQLVLALTGGGSAVIAALLETPGASACVLEAVVPYSQAALHDWLGGDFDSVCSEPAARAMAMASFQRARRFSIAEPAALLGVGATSSLATTREKRGEHRIHVAWQSATTTSVASCRLVKGRRSRAEEERLAAELILAEIARGAFPADASPYTQAGPEQDEPIERREQQAPPGWTELLLGTRRSLSVGAPEQPLERPTLLFPGAFNPFHAGHAQMAELAAERCGQPVTFELSITNVDKPPLDFVEIADRLSQFADRPVLLTRAETFVEKATLVSGAMWVVGCDTIARIADPKYYGGDPARRDAAIEGIARCNCRFLVFGRLLQDRFRTLSSLELPAALVRLCDGVPESQFRADVQSRQLRAARPVC